VRFTVVWVESAAGELAEIWMSAADRPLITAAATDIDYCLRYRPDAAGESRGGDRRLLITGPLAVTYEVRLPDRIVKVLDVWRITRPTT
jgi:hypothetical protein